LLGVFFSPVTGDKVLHGDQQIGAKPTVLRVEFSQGRSFFQQLSKETLGQIDGIMVTKATPTNESVYWVPVDRAQFT